MANAEILLNSAFLAAGSGAMAWFSRDLVGTVLGGIEENIRLQLKAMRIATPHLRTYLTCYLYFAITVFFGVCFGYGSLIFACLSIALLIPFPYFMLNKMAQSRRDKIEDQLANSMTTLSNAIRAGLSIAQALDILAEQSPRPIKQEFQHMVGQYSMGNTLQDTLLEAKERLNSENFSMFAAAMLASRESGGRLNETVERIADSVREFQRLERKVQSETAQARKSAVYMALAPPIILVVYYFVDPINTGRLFTTVPGQFLLSISVIFDVIAFLWARSILTPDL
ncbi:MAG: type II secretion system F family protein [Planctomycetota bacterium]